MPKIKIKEVNKGTIKTLDRSIANSVRVRDAASEITESGKSIIHTPDSQEHNGQNPNEYATESLQGGKQRSVLLGRRAAAATYAKAKGKYAKGRRAESINIKQRTIGARQGRRGAEASAKSSARVMKKRAQATVRNTAKAAKNAGRGAGTIKHIVENFARSVRVLIGTTKALITAMAVGGWVVVVAIVVCCLCGAAFLFFGDTSQGAYLPVSKEVEAYSPLIKQYAKESGIGQYTKLIKAVMMQESGGKGNDPMQSGGANPKESIRDGIKKLKIALARAKCESPVDMARIRLALQGYNYEPAYIDWAMKKDGGFTETNASEYSDMMAKNKGLSSYGDKEYVAHVLRYYPFGNYNYGVRNTAICKVAASQLGNKGGQPYWSWYGYSGRQPWCACFVSWCADKCGYIKSGVIPKFSGCENGVSWFQKRHQWQKRGYKPSPGDIIFFDWDCNGGVNHVGIVERCDGKTVYTIEGNSGDACKRQHYSVGSRVIFGYGVPKY